MLVWINCTSFPHQGYPVGKEDGYTSPLLENKSVKLSAVGN